jgi:hypothetical protein
MSNFIADRSVAARLKEIETEKNKLFGVPESPCPGLTTVPGKRLGVVLFERGKTTFYGHNAVPQIETLHDIAQRTNSEGVTMLRLEGFAMAGELGLDIIGDAPRLASKRAEYAQELLQALGYEGGFISPRNRPHTIVPVESAQPDYLAYRVDIFPAE